jgi:pantothenate kinase
MQTYDELAQELIEKAAGLPDGTRFWLGIAGGPGSGKSTLAAALKARLKQSLVVIPLDGYHYLRSQLNKMENPEEAFIRRGAPFTFDSTRFVNDLVKARSSGEGTFPSFDHQEGDPVENQIQLSSTDKIVVVEGNYLLLNTATWRRLREEVFDETWFLDVSVQESNRRVMERHIKIGLSEEQARQRVATNDGINAEMIAKESPGNADRIIRIR